MANKCWFYDNSTFPQICFLFFLVCSGHLVFICVSLNIFQYPHHMRSNKYFLISSTLNNFIRVKVK